MKKTIATLIGLVFFAATNFAQVINCNPDPDGDPWYVLENWEISPELQARINAVPLLELSDTSANTPLPDSIDNTEHMCMRDKVIYQGMAGCCSQASGIGYIFTYEVNRLRGLASNDSSRRYEYLFQYNFLSNGSPTNGSHIIDGWDIAKQNGAVNQLVPEYGFAPAVRAEWMDGYDKYLAGMHNRLDTYWKIDCAEPDALNLLKHWLNDHNEGASIGGLASFTTNVGDADYVDIDPGSGRTLAVRRWGTKGGHQMTFVGYNDSIKFDYNGDGQITNDVDWAGDFDSLGNIIPDGIVNMRDWEIGVLEVVNSHGRLYGNKGYVYMPYALLLEKSALPPYNNPMTIFVMEADTLTLPQLTLKTSISHPCRDKLKVNVGYAAQAGALSPVETSDIRAFKNQGGPYPMQGRDWSDTLEIGLDFGYWFLDKDFGKIFLVIDETDEADSSYGFVENLSIIDYRWGEEFELACKAANVEITNNGQTLLGIDYHLLPFSIENNLLLETDRVSRFNPSVKNGSTLTVYNKKELVNIDMYSSELRIEQGGSMKILDSCSLNNKGNSKLTVDGLLEVNGYLSTDVDIHVKNGGVLKINSPEGVHLKGSSRIVVELGGTLEFAGTSSEIIGHSEGNQLLLQGDLSYNQEITTFTLSSASVHTPWVGIYLDNASKKFTFPAIDMSYCGIKGNCQSITVNDASFSHANITLNTEKASILNSAFNNAYVLLNNTNPNAISEIEIRNNTFAAVTNSNAKGAICISDYKAYTIAGNTIDNCNNDGLAVFHCGNGSNTHAIEDNTISNCQSTADNVAGIRVYDSYADITDQNKINGNENGLILLNNSNIGLQGFSNTNSLSQTQQIKDNAINQVYASSNSFPAKFSYNAIINEENSSPLVFCNGMNFPALDVSGNYWGNTFNASQDLFPYEYYTYLPIWNLGQEVESSLGGELYAAAVEDVQAANYAGATSKSKQLVQEYTETEYAKAGMKLMLAIESLRNGDFKQLKDYYSQPELQDNNYLKKLAARLANRCNLEQGDYRGAIDWFESVILNPETLEDSVFAIIDLEHTYLLMGNSSGKHAGYVGTLNQYKPESREAHAKNKKELMNLLGGEAKVTAEAEAKGERLIVNKPNPFSGNTVIAYKLEQQTHVCVNIYNVSGQKVMTLVDTKKDKGAYTVELSASHLREGIYTYTLELDGNIIERNKMVLMR